MRIQYNQNIVLDHDGKWHLTVSIPEITSQTLWYPLDTNRKDVAKRRVASAKKILLLEFRNLLASRKAGINSLQTYLDDLLMEIPE